MTFEVTKHMEDDQVERIARAVTEKLTWIDRRVSLGAGLAMEMTDLTPEQTHEFVKEYGLGQLIEQIKNNIDNYENLEEAIALYDNPSVCIRQMLAGVGDAAKLFEGLKDKAGEDDGELQHQ